MKNIIIIIVIGVAGYFGYQHFSGKGPFGDNTMVAYGAVEFETGSGIQEVTPYDPFNAEDYVEPDQPSIIALFELLPWLQTLARASQKVSQSKT